MGFVPLQNATRDVLVVIPAFNEERSVGDVVTNVRRAAPFADVVVIDDGSTDNTADVARHAGAKCLRLVVNQNVGGALRLGFRYARRAGYSIVVQVDADGQHDPGSIRSLVDELRSADIAVGRRGKDSAAAPTTWLRRTAMVSVAGVVSGMIGQKIHDTTSGFRAFGPKAVELFAGYFPADYLGDTIEALVLAHRAGLKIVEIPVTMHERAHGTSTQSSISASLYLIRAVMAIILASIRPAPAARPALATTMLGRIPQPRA